MFQGHIDLDTATPVEASAIPDVLFERGLYWASGRSGVVNLVAAHKWFNLAALKGRTDAISLRREVAEMMSEVEIAMAQREARAWMTAHGPVLGRATWPSRFLSRWPGPVRRRPLRDDGFAELLLQYDLPAVGVSVERGNQRRGMRNHHHLGSFRCLRNQARQRRQQLRMQAGFGFVENHQSRWSRREQGGDEQKIA